MNAHKKKPKPLGWTSKQEPVETVVDNPHFSPDHKVGRTNPIKISATMNARESAITLMYSRRIIDIAQYQAAEWFRAQWEKAGGRGAGAIDYSRVRVDGGAGFNSSSDRQHDASKELNAVRSLVGVVAFTILCRCAGQGHMITDIIRGHRAQRTTGDYLKDALDVVAEYKGYKSPRHTVDNRGYGT